MRTQLLVAFVAVAALAGCGGDDDPGDDDAEGARRGEPT